MDERSAGSTPGTTRRAVAAVIVPAVAWAAALGLSYAVQDFACTAFTSVGQSPPSALIGTIVVVLDAILLAVCVAAGLVAWRCARSARHGGPGAPLLGFLGHLGVLLATVFGASIVLIAVNPFVLEVCA
jgi:hypothetical protein